MRVRCHNLWSQKKRPDCQNVLRGETPLSKAAMDLCIQAVYSLTIKSEP